MLKEQLVKSLRSFRKYHRRIGLILSLFLFISALTGILLALKKDIPVLQPPTQKGDTKELSAWQPLADLAQLAEQAFHEAHPQQIENKIHRMDVRPSKGIVKVLFKKGYWEVQIDGATGEVYSIAQRHSDWIEALHDGSIISDTFKLGSMLTLGTGLIVLAVSGWWLWAGPRRIRKAKKRS